MRFHYLLALLLTMAIGVTYWYQSTSYICPIPVAYRLGTIDESFSITQGEAQQAIITAAQLWEDAVGRNLFEYNDRADLTVSFVFDERQATADARASELERLDEVEAENQEIANTIEQLRNDYESMETSFLERKAVYDENLRAHDERVQQVNDRGGATEAEFTELQAAQQELQTESRSLQRLANELGTVADQLNDLSTEGSRLVRSYNQEVYQYNDQFHGGEEFTQGDYTGDSINIYKFSNENELVTVLAHEFGHALGLGHVEDEQSLMHYLLEEGDSAEPALSEADLAAYNQTCQIDTWDFRVRQIIRGIF